LARNAWQKQELSMRPPAQSLLVLFPTEAQVRAINHAVAATAVLFFLGNLALAEEPARPAERKPDAERPVGGNSQDQAEYLAAVKKCEGLGAKEKQSCIESAKQRFGEMLR
jgi:hypothetical protein